MKRSKHEYLVGFVGDKQCVYGPDDLSENPASGSVRFVDRMTLNQARRRVKELTKAKRVKRGIYKLVLVETI